MTDEIWNDFEKHEKTILLDYLIRIVISDRKEKFEQKIFSKKILSSEDGDIAPEIEKWIENYLLEESVDYLDKTKLFENEIFIQHICTRTIRLSVYLRIETQRWKEYIVGKIEKKFNKIS